jgi:hypothetical protein
MLASAHAQPFGDPKGKLIIVNWNVHVGHGDVAGLIKDTPACEIQNV